MNKCKCDNCNETTNGDFVPGHDQKLRAALEQKVGGLLPLKQLIATCEKYATGNISEAEVLRAVRQAFTRKTDK
jgi:hypothetical protein